MRLLLDTHGFLWYILADPKLPAPFRAAVQDPTNEVFLSIVSVRATPAASSPGMGYYG